MQRGRAIVTGKLPLVIAVGNQKGGVAKTTTTLALAEEAARQGMSVAVVDLDPQCSISEALEPADVDVAGTRELLRRGSGLTLEECLTKTSWGHNIFLCASDPTLTNREHDLTAPGAELTLRTAIDRGSGGVDLILLDLPPSRGRLPMQGLAAADRVLIPTEAATYAARAVVMLMTDTLPRAARFIGHPVEVAGILLTKWAGRREERRVREELVSAYGDAGKDAGGLVLTPPIPRHEIVKSTHESLHIPLREAADPYATAVADAYAVHFTRILTPSHAPKGRHRR
jgi:chromosome partitioning protein